MRRLQLLSQIVVELLLAIDSNEKKGRIVTSLTYANTLHIASLKLALVV